MADYLKNFVEGQAIKASDTNSNNQFLLDKVGENYDLLKNWLDGQIGQINSTIQSVQATLQANINELKATVESNDNKTFTQKSLNIGIGTTNLSSYLPNDSKQYLIFINAQLSAKSGDSLNIRSDIMTAPRTVLRLDGDAGRSSADCAFFVIPVGSGRTITTSGTANSITLCGYCRV